jgi:hypothetical protein
MGTKQIDYVIYCPSYKRADICKTHKYLPNVVYVVGEFEAEEYKKIHPHVWAVPNKVQGKLERVRNYILDNDTENDHIILMDDDINHFGRFNGPERIKLDAQGVDLMISKGIQLAEDFDVRFWGINCLADKGAYREYTPFGTRQYIGGPFQAHFKNPCRYDEEMYLKEDYDMTLQVLAKFRKNLRLNMYHYVCAQNTITGGCAEYRNIDVEMEQNDKLRKKWGSEIIHFDTSNKSGKVKNYDINPIIKIPIKGV